MGCGCSDTFEEESVEYSSTKSDMDIEKALPPPKNLRLTEGTDGELYLCWNAPTSIRKYPVTGYNVYSYFPDHVKTKTPVTVDKTECLLSNVFINNDDKNLFAVSAIYGSNHSKLSFITLKPPSGPVDLVVKNSESGTFLSWNPPNDNGGAPITNYIIYLYSDIERNMTLLQTLGNEYRYQIQKSKVRTNNKFGVQAKNVIGKGTISTVKIDVLDVAENRKLTSPMPVQTCTDKNVYTSENELQDSDKGTQKNVTYVSTYYHKFENHLDSKGCKKSLNDDNKIKFVECKERETPENQKSKFNLPLTNDRKEVKVNNGPDFVVDMARTETYEKTDRHIFAKRCDMQGCEAPSTTNLNGLTLQCKHTICFNCYDKVKKYLHWSIDFKTYEIICMVCGVYSSVEIFTDADNKIRHLECKETDREKRVKADLATSEIKGIPNIGLACYANCILQVLAQTPTLVCKLKDLVDKIQKAEKVPLSSILLDILDSFKCDDGIYLDSRLIQCLIDKIHDIDNSFDPFRQNDCHSFLITLFNGIKDELQSTQMELKNKFLKNPMEMFEGKMCNYFEYLPCKHSESSGDQVFTSLLIPIRLDRANEQWSIEEGLRLMMGSEEFDGEELPCTICESAGNTLSCHKITTKTFGISEPPSILILQLGRFFEVRGKLTKIKCGVTYKQLIDIDVLDNAAQKPVCLKYELYSVVLHYGSLESGHYYSYVKSQANGQWFYCSDRYVRKISDPFEQGFKEAYLLFYQKITN